MASGLFYAKGRSNVEIRQSTGNLTPRESFTWVVEIIENRNICNNMCILTRLLGQFPRKSIKCEQLSLVSRTKSLYFLDHQCLVL